MNPLPPSTVVQTVVYPEHRFSPEDLMGFIQSSHFSRNWDAFGLSDTDLQALEIAIMADPKAHPVVAGTGGLRKLRMADASSSKGKRGGYRVGYVYFEKVSVVFLLVVYPKNQTANMSKKEKTACKKLITEIERTISEGSFR